VIQAAFIAAEDCGKGLEASTDFLAMRNLADT